MLYQIAKSELQAPPHVVSLSALVVEAGAVILTTFGLLWLF